MSNKKCKKCKKSENDCTCPKKGRGGWFGFGSYDHDDANHGADPSGDSAGDGGGAMGEGIKMPQAPIESDKDTGERKRKNLRAFQSAVADAKKRQSDRDKSEELAKTKAEKGMRFYDKQGSGYIKGGKKIYD